MVYDETIRNLKEVQLENEKLQQRFDVNNLCYNLFVLMLRFNCH
jgi:hypothetical protein